VIRKEPKWFDVVITPICDAEGKPERLLAVSRDVTEHQLNEKALREAHLRVARSEERSRSLLEINNAIITSLTQGALLRSIAKALRRVVAFDASALTLYLPERDTFASSPSKALSAPSGWGRRSSTKTPASGGYSTTGGPAYAAISRRSSSTQTNDSSPLKVCALTA